MGAHVYKLLQAFEWMVFEETGVFLGTPLDFKDGYIHLSTAEQAAETARLHFKNKGPLVLVEFKASDFVSDEGLPTATSVNTTCHRDVKALVTERELTYNKSFKASPNDALKIAFAQMGYPRLDISVPAYIGTGVMDRDTPMRMQANLIRQACAAGATIQSNIYPGKDHLTVLNHSTVDSIPFVKAAFAGETIAGNCDALPFEKKSQK